MTELLFIFSLSLSDVYLYYIYFVLNVKSIAVQPQRTDFLKRQFDDKLDLCKRICLLNYGSISNWMNLRDADSGKILWQGNEDL